MKTLTAAIIICSLLLPAGLLAQDFSLAPQNAELEPGIDAAFLSWENPGSKFFKETIIFRSTIPIEDFFTYEAVAGLCDLIYQGEEESYIDTELAPNLPYYYILFSQDIKEGYSRAVILEREPLKGKEDKELSNLAGAESAVVNSVAKTEAGLVYNYNGPLELNENARRLSLFIIVKSPKDLKQKDKNAISYFINNGTPTTILLGSGERAGVLNSYLSAFNKLPTSELEWQDVIKIGNGRWPDERSEKAEDLASETFFRAVYQRAPDMDDPNDNAAVTVIAYGLRPARRNLDSEKKAILIYRSIFNQNPSGAADWDIVRAIAYSGAVR